MHVFSRVCLIASLLSFAVLSGCGENRGLVKIAGTVTIDGKEPPIAGSITFLPEQGQNEAMQATATFEKDGKFAASTWEQGDGLRPGKYKVRIECWETVPSLYGSKGVSLIDRKVTDWGDNSAMPRLEVVAGQPKANIIFDVKAAADTVIQAERTAHKAAEADAPKMMMP